MISESKTVTRQAFQQATGWQIKPEGACWGDRCVPLANSMPETIDLEGISDALHMPLLHDQETGLWALGPESSGRAITDTFVPELELTDWQDQPFKLSSLRGSKVLMIAWASW